MIHSRFITSAAIMLCFLFVSSDAMAAGSRPSVPHIKPDALNGMLQNPDLVIIDVRDSLSWSRSTRKIQGAVREDPELDDKWITRYPKTGTIILY